VLAVSARVNVRIHVTWVTEVVFSDNLDLYHWQLHT
jgi:hypothetical protein